VSLIDLPVELLFEGFDGGFDFLDPVLECLDYLICTPSTVELFFSTADLQLLQDVSG
jgi:hypothetical protein